MLARQQASNGALVTGSVGSLSYRGAATPDRSVSSYCARLPARAPAAPARAAVVVTNSLAQLARLAEVGTAQGARALATTPAYAFFRTRYAPARDELALLVISDETIRRWCSARWRIADHRRIIAASALAEMQARAVDHKPLGTLAKALARNLDLDLGAISEQNGVFASSIYGSLGFLTPIAEIPIAQVSAREAEAYDWFRQSYQSRLGPLVRSHRAARLSRGAAGGIGMDLSVLPLNASTSYREFLEAIGDASFSAEQGDPHSGTLAHGIMAIDHKSQMFQLASGVLAGSAMQRLGADPFGWLGTSVAAVYACTIDPVWRPFFSGANPESELEKHIAELPVAVDISDRQSAQGVFALPHHAPWLHRAVRPGHGHLVHRRLGTTIPTPSSRPRWQTPPAGRCGEVRGSSTPPCRTT